MTGGAVFLTLKIKLVMKKSKNNVLTEDDKTPWEYQGKRRDQVESSASVFTACLIIIFSLALLYLLTH